MGDVYSCDGNSALPPTDAQRRRLLLQRPRQAASTSPGQTPIAGTPAPDGVQSADQPLSPPAGSMLQAVREANAAPSPAVSSQPAAGWFAVRARTYLRDQIGRAIDNSTGFDENGKPGALAQGVLNAGRVGWSYIPGLRATSQPPCQIVWMTSNR